TQAGLVNFNLIATLPPGTCPEDIQKATLLMWVNTVVTPGTFSASLVTQSWTETGVNWNNRPTAGTPTTTATVPGSGQFAIIDVTDHVKAWVAGTSCTPESEEHTSELQSQSNLVC